MREDDLDTRPDTRPDIPRRRRRRFEDDEPPTRRHTVQPLELDGRAGTDIDGPARRRPVVHWTRCPGSPATA